MGHKFVKNVKELERMIIHKSEELSLKHMAGKHPQKSHAGSRGSTGSSISADANKNVEESLELAGRYGAQPKQCWFNSVTLLSAVPGAEYVEGYYATEISSDLTFPIEHGWLEKDGEIIDVTLPTDTGNYYAAARYTMADVSKLLAESDDIDLPLTPQRDPDMKTAMAMAHNDAFGIDLTSMKHMAGKHPQKSHEGIDTSAAMSTKERKPDWDIDNLVESLKHMAGKHPQKSHGRGGTGKDGGRTATNPAGFKVEPMHQQDHAKAERKWDYPDDGVVPLYHTTNADPQSILEKGLEPGDIWGVYAHQAPPPVVNSAHYTVEFEANLDKGEMYAAGGYSKYPAVNYQYPEDNTYNTGFTYHGVWRSGGRETGISASKITKIYDNEADEIVYTRGEKLKELTSIKGGSGSGDWGHTGRPGKVGGSGGGGGLAGLGLKPSSTVAERSAASRGKGKPKKTAPKKTTPKKTTPKKTTPKKTTPKKTTPKKLSSELSLNEFEESIRHLDYEHAAVYKDGKLVFHKRGKATEVNFDLDEMDKMKGAVVTHTHPAKLGDVVHPDGGSFSRSDLNMMETTGAAEMRAVSTKYQYSVKPRFMGSIKLSQGLNNKYSDAIEYAKAEGNDLYRKGKLSKSDFPVEVTHMALQRLNEQGWLIYERKAY